MPQLEPNLIVYIRSMGKALRVTGIFTDIEETNKYLSRRDNRCGVVDFVHVSTMGMPLSVKSAVKISPWVSATTPHASGGAN